MKSDFYYSVNSRCSVSLEWEAVPSIMFIYFPIRLFEQRRSQTQQRSIDSSSCQPCVCVCVSAESVTPAEGGWDSGEAGVPARPHGSSVYVRFNAYFFFFLTIVRTTTVEAPPAVSGVFRFIHSLRCVTVLSVWLFYLERLRWSKFLKTEKCSFIL